jgi:hypothetical protein
MTLREYFKKNLTEKQIKKLKRIMDEIRSVGNGSNLNKLATIYGTDKWGLHFYTKHYDTHFKSFRDKKISFLEIGVGGHDNPRAGGSSLRMWKKYFPYANINSIDIYDKSFLEEKRIRIFKGSQIDHAFLLDVIKEIGNPDIIIDDGSHVNSHVIETFKILFPLLKDGGIYAIEDTQTSYWPSFGGDSQNLDNSNTIQNFFKKLTDSLNYEEFLIEGYQPSYYDKNIISMHFYHNQIIIYKGNNSEGSNKNQNHTVLQ